MDKKIRVGLYGTNGHQIQKQLEKHPKAELVAVAAFDEKALPSLGKKCRICSSLDELIADDGSKTWQCSDSDYCNQRLAEPAHEVSA